MADDSGLMVLFKAIIPGGAVGNLFATPVHVASYTTKDGVHVPAHTALRHKHLSAAKPTAVASTQPPLDLFSVMVPPVDPVPAPHAPPASAPAIAPPPVAHAIVEHVTRRGKTLRGVVRTDLSHAEAKAIDEYTFKKDGGWFIRERHFDGAHAGPAATSDTAQTAPDSPARATKDILATAKAVVDDRKRQADKLRDVADSLGSKAQESMNRDRQANTHRRARLAAGAYETAANDLRIADTMMNLASAIENGEAMHLAGVNSRAAVEALDHALRQGKYARARAESVNWEKAKEEPIGPADIQHARMPSVWLHQSSAKDMARALQTFLPKGNARTIQWLETLGAQDTVRPLSGQQVDQLRSLAADLLKVKDPGRDGYLLSTAKRLKSDITDVDRIAKLGIANDAQMQAALVEYVQYRGGTKSEDPIKRMERELVGNTGIGIDFFPTPPALADQLVEQADIEPGMRVLEPSAGKGDLADKMRAAGAQVDVVELSGTLKPILEAKGHTVVASDFMTFEPPKGGYDRVVMNPPFSDGMDAEHVRRAYGMLKPGGRLVAITGEGIHFRQDRKAAEFRDWLEQHGGSATKLPEGSFKSAFRSTGVATRVVVIDKPLSEPMVKAEGAVHADFHAAMLRAVSKKGDAVTPDEIARHWPGHSADDALDVLHACRADYAMHPIGDRWLPAGNAAQL